MGMFKLHAIKSFLHGLCLIDDEANHLGLTLSIPLLYFDVKQKPVLCGESKDYKNREKESYEAIAQSSREKCQKKSSKEDDNVSGVRKKEFALKD
eukprot:1938326-Ditylum_brightwellii.AAC.1